MDRWFRWLGRRDAPADSLPTVRQAFQPAADLSPIPLRVSVIVHNPILENYGGRKLSQTLGWNDPDRLAQQYREDMLRCSGGLAQYEVVERFEVDGYPVKIDGFRYDDASYMHCRQAGGWHMPDQVDYGLLLAEFDVLGKVERREIDEVWLLGFPYAGYYESTMGGAGAFWCNSPPIPGTENCSRRFVVMGFNYERDVGCMLEDFGHRVESIMSQVYRHHAAERNLWARFTLHDKIAPGRAECGNVHFAPNSQSDYDWGNPRPVLCRADTWYSFPDLSGSPRRMTCVDWGNGDMRAHHLWWLDHLPRVPGETGGVSNNWCAYALDPNRVR